jgi:hypothetical protein
MIKNQLKKTLTITLLSLLSFFIPIESASRFSRLYKVAPWALCSITPIGRFLNGYLTNNLPKKELFESTIDNDIKCHNELKSYLKKGLNEYIQKPKQRITILSNLYDYNSLREEIILQRDPLSDDDRINQLNRIFCWNPLIADQEGFQAMCSAGIIDSIVKAKNREMKAKSSIDCTSAFWECMFILIGIANSTPLTSLLGILYTELICQYNQRSLTKKLDCLTAKELHSTKEIIKLIELHSKASIDNPRVKTTYKATLAHKNLNNERSLSTILLHILNLFNSKPLPNERIKKLKQLQRQLDTQEDPQKKGGYIFAHQRPLNPPFYPKDWIKAILFTPHPLDRTIHTIYFSKPEENAHPPSLKLKVGIKISKLAEENDGRIDGPQRKIKQPAT